MFVNNNDVKVLEEFKPWKMKQMISSELGYLAPELK